MIPGRTAFEASCRFVPAGAVRDSAAGDHRLDALFPQQAAVLVEVVAAVSVQAPWLATGTAAQSSDRRHGVQQGHEVVDVVAVAAGECDTSGVPWRSTIR